jgi:hypothetical protein
MEWEAQSGIDWPLCISADCDVWLANARKNKCITLKGRPGDIVILVSGNDAYHIGIVAGYSESGTLISIEGNSNNDGSRNGYMVAKRNNVYSGRNKDNVFFIHPWGLIQSGSDWKIVYGDKHIVALLHNSKTYAPVREFVRLVAGTDDTLSWEDGPVYNGKPLALQCILRDGKSYAAIRDLAGCFNFDCVVNTSCSASIISSAGKHVRQVRPCFVVLVLSIDANDAQHQIHAFFVLAQSMSKIGRGAQNRHIVRLQLECLVEEF